MTQFQTDTSIINTQLLDLGTKLTEAARDIIDEAKSCEDPVVLNAAKQKLEAALVDLQTTKSSGPTVIIKSKLTQIEVAVGENFFGPDHWKILGVGDVQMPDLDDYPILTQQFLDNPFEYNPDLKRSEAGVLLVIPKGMSINTFKSTVNNYWKRQKGAVLIDDNHWQRTGTILNQSHTKMPDSEEKSFRSISSFDEIAATNTDTNICFLARSVPSIMLGKSFEEQSGLLYRDTLPASTIGLLSYIGLSCIHHIDTEFDDMYARTGEILKDTIKYDSKKNTGFFLGGVDERGIFLGLCHKDARFDNIGLGIEWKLQK